MKTIITIAFSDNYQSLIDELTPDLALATVESIDNSTLLISEDWSNSARSGKP